MAGLVPQAVFDAYNTFVDSLINFDFGVPCTLLYPSAKTSCANCVYDTINDRSSNVYNGTGPVPFGMGLCPWCDGKGFLEVPYTDQINLRVYFSRRYWIKVGPMMAIPDGTVQCIGLLSDMPKILRAEKMQINSAEAGYGTLLYVLHGEPYTVGFQHNRYIISYWKRE